MDTQDFSRSRALNNLPSKKLSSAIAAIENSNETGEIKILKLIAINRYAESNIPIEYWTLKMERDFTGDPRLLDKYNEYISDLNKNYHTGSSICFAGTHGVGKTFAATCILKKACQKGYTCLYTEASKMVAAITQSSNEEKWLAGRELSMVDFLAIDELDNRFFASEAANDLFAKSFETIFRGRKQNKLPTIICTNSPNLVESFQGTLKQSIGSLFADGIQIFPILGTDYRKNK